MSTLVHLRFDDKTRTAMRDVITREHFSSETEFVRDAVRKSLEQYARLALLQSVRQQVPRRKNAPGPTSDIFGEFGIDIAKVPKASTRKSQKRR
jgi:Arc/MetJ-type ribon-helix-helix transcriptional regulator